jgi:hypothetical protein
MLANIAGASYRYKKADESMEYTEHVPLSLRPYLVNKNINKLK